MSIALFRRDGKQIVPLPAAAGPWMPNALSGSAVGPLMAALVDEIPAPCPMLVSRLSVEFLRPVPMAPLQADVTVVREGRKQQVLQIALRCGDKGVATATAVRLRLGEEAPGGAGPEGFEPPSGPRFVPPVGGSSPVLDWVESRMLRSNDGGPGVTEVWLRFKGQVIEGRALTPLTRAAMFADYGNGLAPVVDANRFTYLNAELSLHLARLPRGEWLHLQSRTLDGGAGLGMVHTRMGDALGTLGWAHQALLFQPR